METFVHRNNQSTFYQIGVHGSDDYKYAFFFFLTRINTETLMGSEGGMIVLLL